MRAIAWLFAAAVVIALGYGFYSYQLRRASQEVPEFRSAFDRQPATGRPDGPGVDRPLAERTMAPEGERASDSAAPAQASQNTAARPAAQQAQRAPGQAVAERAADTRRSMDSARVQKEREAARLAVARAQFRAENAARYEGFFTSFDIDAEKKEAFLDLLVAEYDQNAKTLQYILENGLPKQEAIALRHKDLENAIERRREVLGKDLAKALSEYSGIQTFHPIAEEFSSRCAAQGTPIGGELVEKAAGVLAKYQGIKSSPAQSKSDALALEQMAGVLSPAQLEVFKQVLLERRLPGTRPKS